MAYPPRASLAGVDLPVQFSYTPYVPRKRTNTRATANAVVHQYAKPAQIVHGDSGLPWTCPKCTPVEWQQFYTWYAVDVSTLYAFVGYWGETLSVRFIELDEPSVRGRMFDVSGMFQVVCVTVAMNAVCEPVI